ncbi:MAG: putative lipid II flippase FtsW [Candidatus Kerfeldbacteria bacterium]|nr:putative lipid II flippase FtsW [Candidatus Kerfeldbacteria bacterium]
MSSYAAKHHPDYIFLGLALLLVLFGLLFLSSASSVVAWQKLNDSYYYLKHQIFYGLVPGLILFFLFSRLNYQTLRKIALPLLVFSLILLVLVFVPGISLAYGGARRWLNLAGYTFQPSELIKLSFLIYLAAWLEGRGERLRSFKEGVVPFILTVGTVGGLIILQPDLGTASVIAVSSFLTYLVAGANLAHLLTLGLGGLGLLWLVVKFEPYRAARLTVFLHPELDPQGIGYHINQALLAVGSGGFWGLGLGYSRQKYQYLPEVTGDSIFAVMAEELGFLFTLLFLVLIFSFLWRGLRLAQRAPDAFGRYLASGILIWLGFQTCINIASMLGILPLTGVPLPFVSFGGSALMATLAGLGILTNISRQIRITPKV